jgi:hypothetical protein
VRRESRKQPKQDLKSGVFYCNKSLPQNLLYLKGLGREIDLKKFEKWIDLGLKKGSSSFLYFSEAPPILEKLEFLAVNAKSTPIAYVYPRFL